MAINQYDVLDIQRHRVVKRFWRWVPECQLSVRVSAAVYLSIFHSISHLSVNFEDVRSQLSFKNVSFFN